LTHVPDLAEKPAASAPTLVEQLTRPPREVQPATPAGRSLLDAGRFGLVGLGGILVNQVALWALVEGLRLHYLPAAVLSAQVAIASNFTLTELWVYTGRRSGSLTARAATFAAVSNSTLLLQVPLLGLFTTVLGLHYLLSNMLSVALLFVVRFILSDRIIWRLRQEPPAPPSRRSTRHGRGRDAALPAVAAHLVDWTRSVSAGARMERALRVPLAVAAVAGAYHYSLRTLLDGLGDHTRLAYIGMIPFVGLLLLIAQATAIRQEPNIHDRQVDYIVGLAILGLAFVVLFVVRMRLMVQFWLWRIDLASLPLFVAGVIVLLFGLRTLWRVRAGVAFLLLAWPPLGRRLAGLDAAAFSASHADLSHLDGLGGLAGCTVVAVALTLLVRGRPVARIAWLATGVLFAWALQMVRLHGLVATGLPSLLDSTLAIVVAAAVMWLAKRGFGLHGPRWRPEATAAVAARRDSWAVPRPRLAFAVVLVATLVAGLANARLSAFRAVSTDLGEVRLAAFSPAADRLPGWSAVRTASFPIITRYLGPDARWDRYSYRASGSHLETPRQLVADVTSTSDATALATQPAGVIYGLRAEPAPVQRMEVGPGLTGRIERVEQQALGRGRLGWTMVSWQWPVRGADGRVRQERVTLLSESLRGDGADQADALTAFARRLVQTRLATARPPYRVA
jgi:putative flippase GtrA